MNKPKIVELKIYVKKNEYERIISSANKHQPQDVTLIIPIQNKWVVIKKHYYQKGIYRFPSGLVKKEESLITCGIREGYEETGLKINMKKYLVKVFVDFIYKKKQVQWVSNVFLAEKVSGQLRIIDDQEIEELKLLSYEEIQGPVRDRMLQTDSGGLKYRSILADIVFKVINTFNNALPK